MVVKSPRANASFVLMSTTGKLSRSSDPTYASSTALLSQEHTSMIVPCSDSVLEIISFNLSVSYKTSEL